jgi:hypothetical protein
MVDPATQPVLPHVNSSFVNPASSAARFAARADIIAKRPMERRTPRDMLLISASVKLTGAAWSGVFQCSIRFTAL